MIDKHGLSPHKVRVLLDYFPETGELFWRRRDSKDFYPSSKKSALAVSSQWNGRLAGTRALTATDRSGYLNGHIHKHRYRAHRVAWAHYYGYWPSIIDHIDGDRTNNRISNLRIATAQQNACNRQAASGKTSKYLGVSWHEQNKKWWAKAFFGGREMHLGFFSSEREAAQAYDNAARKHNREFGRFNFPKNGEYDAKAPS